jgi:signal peptidase I
MTDTPSSPARSAAGLGREIIDIARTVGLALAIALALRIVLFQPFTIPSSSMEPGLVTGDYIVVSKLAYGWSRASLPLNPPLFKGRLLERTARRGDVVVFRLPRDPSQTWIKRVIGLPGDRVRVQGGRVFVNGQAIPQTPMRVTRDHDAPDRPVLAIGERTPDGRRYVTYDGGPDQPGDDTDVYVVARGPLFRDGRQSRQLAGQPLAARTGRGPAAGREPGRPSQVRAAVLAVRRGAAQAVDLAGPADGPFPQADPVAAGDMPSRRVPGAVSVG